MTITIGRVKEQIRSRIEASGLVIESASHHIDRRRGEVLTLQATDLVLDIGAAEGQYAKRIRRMGYTGQILSFEPRLSSRSELLAAAGRDSKWTVDAFALGSVSGTSYLNVTSSAHSSSLLSPVSEADPGGHLELAGKEQIEVRRLDEVAAVRKFNSVHLKADVQGFELEVLRSADAVLERVSSLELELTLAPLYRDQPLIDEVLRETRRLGFKPVCFERGFADSSTGHLLQIDALFVRDSSTANEALGEAHPMNEGLNIK
jgi:FkbM family methyltransferase